MQNSNKPLAIMAEAVAGWFGFLGVGHLMMGELKNRRDHDDWLVDSNCCHAWCGIGYSWFGADLYSPCLVCRSNHISLRSCV